MPARPHADVVSRRERVVRGQAPSGDGLTARAEKPRRSVVQVAIAVFVLALLALLLYTGGYVLLGSAWRPGPGPGPYPIRMRVFPHSQLATLYRPAAWVESRIRGYNIVSGDEESLFTASP